MKGWSGTIVWIDWEGTCRIWNELLSLRTKEEWNSWYKKNGSLILDGVDSESTPPWRPTLANKVIHAQRSELTVYDEAKVLRTWTRRDFLINKRVKITCSSLSGMCCEWAAYITWSRLEGYHVVEVIILIRVRCNLFVVAIRGKINGTALSYEIKDKIKGYNG